MSRKSSGSQRHPGIERSMTDFAGWPTVKTQTSTKRWWSRLKWEQDWDRRDQMKWQSSTSSSNLDFKHNRTAYTVVQHSSSSSSSTEDTTSSSSRKMLRMAFFGAHAAGLQSFWTFETAASSTANGQCAAFWGRTKTPRSMQTVAPTITSSTPSRSATTCKSGTHST